MATIHDRSETLARSIRPWGFPIIYLGWALLFWSPIFGSEESVWTGTNLVLFLVGGASPLIAGVTMAWLTGGAERVRDLGRRLVDLGRISPKWWLVVLLFWLAFDLLTAGAALAFGVTDRPIDVRAEVLGDVPRTEPLLALALAALAARTRDHPASPRRRSTGVGGTDHGDRLRRTVIAATCSSSRPPGIESNSFYSD